MHILMDNVIMLFNIHISALKDYQALKVNIRTVYF